MEKRDKLLLGGLAGLLLLYLAIQHLNVILRVLGFIGELIFPLFVGCIIAYILSLPMGFIEKHLPIQRRSLRRVSALLLAVLFILGVFALIGIIVVPQVRESLTQIAAQIPIALENALAFWEANQEGLSAFLPQFDPTQLDWKQLASSLSSSLPDSIGSLWEAGTGFVGGLVGGVVDVLFALVFAAHLLLRKEELKRQLLRVMRAYLKPPVINGILHVTSLAHQVCSSFLTGQCIEACILGSLFVVVMTLLRLPYAMLIGVVIAVTALVPIVGAFVGCTLGVLLILITSPLKALEFLILFLIIQQLENQLIYPKVVGTAVGLPAIWIFAAVVVGGKLMGVLGMFLMIPLTALLYLLLREDVQQRIHSLDASAPTEQPSAPESPDPPDSP